jgi:hypothetical protein
MWPLISEAIRCYFRFQQELGDVEALCGGRGARASEETVYVDEWGMHWGNAARFRGGGTWRV